MSFSSTTLFPGAQTFLTLSFLVVPHSFCPLQWPHSTHQAYQITSHNYTPLLRALVYSYVQIQLKVGDFSDFFFNWLGIDLGWHTRGLKIAFSQGAHSAFPLWSSSTLLGWFGECPWLLFMPPMLAPSYFLQIQQSVLLDCSWLPSTTGENTCLRAHRSASLYRVS